MLVRIIKSSMQFMGRRLSSIAVNNSLHTLDTLQVAALKEKCFLVDENDRIVGNATKMECHMLQADGKIPLHRAFSVFLFNSRGDLLLQRRSSTKITYPDCCTNTCCSHPLLDFPGEEEENNAIGVKRAAQRRLNYELGIPVEQIPLNKFKYLTRIHYFDLGDGKWGEHEIDYVLFLQADVDLVPNSHEVNEITFVPQSHMNTFTSTLEGPMTPWFSLIVKHRLRLWWSNLDNLEKFEDHETIHKLT